MKDLRLIALDLDGTVLNSQKQVSPFTREILEYAIRQNIAVVIASGRSLAALPANVLTIEGLNYAVTSNGSSIFSLTDQQRIYAQDMQPDTVKNILSIISAYDFPYEVFIAGYSYTCQAYYNCPTDFGVPERMNTYVKETRLPVDNMYDFVLSHIDEIEGMNFIIPDPDLKHQLRTQLSKLPDLYLTDSEPYYLEIASGSVSKASALQQLCTLIGLTSEHAIAFGDGANDIEMLAWAGHGIAMKNAAPVLLAAADDVTLSNDEDGVAHYLKKLLFNDI